MHKKMSKLAWALLILAGALTSTLTPKNVDAQTCRQILEDCSAGCTPEDTGCYEFCQCKFLTCRGRQCN